METLINRRAIFIEAGKIMWHFHTRKNNGVTNLASLSRPALQLFRWYWCRPFDIVILYGPLSSIRGEETRFRDQWKNIDGTSLVVKSKHRRREKDICTARNNNFSFLWMSDECETRLGRIGLKLPPISRCNFVNGGRICPSRRASSIMGRVRAARDAKLYEIRRKTPSFVERERERRRKRQREEFGTRGTM